MRHEEDGMYHVGLRKQMMRADLWNQPAPHSGPLCQDQVRHQGQPLLVELEG